MSNSNHETLKESVQEVIDLMANRHKSQAMAKLAAATDCLDELLDHAKDDAELRELSRYQVLLDQLKEKLHAN